ncbi:hypothetical protein [Mesorhizobium sp. A623]
MNSASGSIVILLTSPAKRKPPRTRNRSKIDRTALIGVLNPKREKWEPSNRCGVLVGKDDAMAAVPEPTPKPTPPPPPIHEPRPVREPDPDRLPDEAPLPNPDENDAPPKHADRPKQERSAG